MRWFLTLSLAAILAAGDGDYAEFDARAILGVRMSPPSPAAQIVNRIPRQRGVEVLAVLPGTAAEAMGLQPGDVIEELNGLRIHLMADVRNEVALSGVGGPITAAVLRDGERIALRGTLGAWPSDVPYEPLDTAAEAAHRRWQQDRLVVLAGMVEQAGAAVEQLEREAASPRRGGLAAESAAALAAMPALRLRLRLRAEERSAGGPPRTPVAWDARVLIGVPKAVRIH
jgi:membrane-associated protease RseP (regulator of RpoE activity)